MHFTVLINHPELRNAITDRFANPGMTDAILTTVVCDDAYFLFSRRHTNSKDGASSAIEINLNINFGTHTSMRNGVTPKLKLTLTLTDTEGAVLMVWYSRV